MMLLDSPCGHRQCDGVSIIRSGLMQGGLRADVAHGFSVILFCVSFSVSVSKRISGTVQGITMVFCKRIEICMVRALFQHCDINAADNCGNAIGGWRSEIRHGSMKSPHTVE
ncbi:hypothetical protein DVU_1546 [Nitratidesulfovibrio vulgaris str. Hildenborough]|uniref:Uncharacterized protein n=1 Tax=Nitratidesulfovibrio vulgaris (strain ATCC 29579 / DSM 644 / CCUG 34227 / NCIMB 8303 / VKM B-1760 / Hildenborough) TaxID=882 RepID=Q72BT8_NITV2|nr:hypothetical protein DVU_1546 [Nitratidesulfovibrio vulgaris str. Hildenborough]